MAAHAQLSAAVSGDHDVSDHHGRHGRGFSIADVTDLRLPDLLPAIRIDGNRVGVERVVNDLAVGVARSPVDDVAAGDAYASARQD